MAGGMLTSRHRIMAATQSSRHIIVAPHTRRATQPSRHTTVAPHNHGRRTGLEPVRIAVGRPRAAGARSRSADECWRDGNLLVCRRVMPMSIDGTRPHQSDALLRAAKLPNRCIKCNAPTDSAPLGSVLAWHHPAFHFLLPFSVVIQMWSLAPPWENYAALQIGVCDRHRFRQQVVAASPSVLLAVTFCVLTFLPGYLARWQTNYVLAAAVFFVLGAGLSMLSSRWLAIKKLNRNHVWLKGAAPEYLDELSKFSG